MSLRKIHNSLKNLIDSLESLKVGINHDEIDSIVIDASIYRYQVVYRLLWKSLKRILEFEGYNNLDSPRNILKLCFSIYWINSEKKWLEIIAINNEITQAYTDKQLSINLFIRIKDIYSEIEELSIKMREKYEINVAKHIM
jgi:nucleotidyltransferase substrate binding protein (TIGR01987 family)